MSKKLMLLTAGVLAALAFTALPSFASAGEFLNTCSTGLTCKGTIVGGKATLQEDNVNLPAVECNKASGNATAIHNSSTGTVELTFEECHQDGQPGILCTNVAGKTDQITTNILTSHNVYLEEKTTQTPVGVLLTGVNVTFACAGGLVKRQVTGNVIGEITNPECGKAKGTHSFAFAAKALGTQKWEQVTTAGPLFDLTSGSDGPDSTTASQAGTGTITWAAGTTNQLDCDPLIN